jgi:methylthioribose-1-phosphate isomerase
MINPAFDITSRNLIAGVITEKEISYYPRKVYKKII